MPRVLVAKKKKKKKKDVGSENNNARMDAQFECLTTLFQEVSLRGV
jgi:hypothetical protein